MPFPVWRPIDELPSRLYILGYVLITPSRLEGWSASVEVRKSSRFVRNNSVELSVRPLRQVYHFQRPPP